MAYFFDFAWAVRSFKPFASDTKEASVGGAKGIAVKSAGCRTVQGDGWVIMEGHFWSR